jgi:hypothetical protein
MTGQVMKKRAYVWSIFIGWEQVWNEGCPFVII